MSQAQATRVLAPWEFAVSRAIDAVFDRPLFMPRTPSQIGPGRRTLKHRTPGTRDPNARPRIAAFMAAADLGTKPRAGSSYRAARRNAARVKRRVHLLRAAEEKRSTRA